MKMWEYKVVSIEGTTADELENFLDTQGEFGWELVGFSFGHAIFKRPKE